MDLSESNQISRDCQTLTETEGLAEKSDSRGGEGGVSAKNGGTSFTIKNSGRCMPTWIFFGGEGSWKTQKMGEG